MGKKYHNDCMLVLFAYTAGIWVNLSTDWRYTAVCIFGALGYYITRLGFATSVSFTSVCLIWGAFYVLNVLTLQINQKQDEELMKKVYTYYTHYMRINDSISQKLRASILPNDFEKFSNLNISMCKLLDYLPYSILIENGKEILVYNSKMLDFLSIGAHEQNVEIKIEAKLNLIKISTGKFCLNNHF